jgi:uncharacterized membrane protein YhaH (DUF805 family)
MSWFVAALKKYAVFRGRACRREYWYFFLFYLLISIVLSLMDAILGSSRREDVGLLGGLFALGMLLPAIGVGVRRLHDIGKSGWWLLVGFVPVIGGLVLLLFAVRDSEPGGNAYGPNPKLAPPPDAVG